MLQITGEARFADVLELSLYNAVLAGISLDGTRFFYTNTLRQLDPMPVDLRWSRQREPFISCFCCPPNVVRTIAEVGSYAYGRSDDKVWVHLYGGNTLDTELADGGRLRLTQETDYPWDGRVTITVEAAPERPCSLMLRIPGWAGGATAEPQRHARCDGRPEPGTYAEVRRAWSAGDVVELTLPMPVRLMQAHPLVEEARNQVAVLRGPIVYCLESADLAEGRPGLGRRDPARDRADAALRPRPARRRHGPRRPGRGLARGRLVRASSTASCPPRTPTADRPEADPVLRLGQPGPIGDDGLDAPRTLETAFADDTIEEPHADSHEQPKASVLAPGRGARVLAVGPRPCPGRPRGRAGRAVGDLRDRPERALGRQPVRRRRPVRPLHAGGPGRSTSPASTTATGSTASASCPIGRASGATRRGATAPSWTARPARSTWSTPSAGNHGPVRVRTTFHFAYADGTPYFPIGTTCYAWTHQGDALEEQTLATLKHAPFNKMRMCVFPKCYAYNQNEPPLYPFAGHAAARLGLHPVQPGVLPPPRAADRPAPRPRHRGRPDPVPPLRQGPLGLRPDGGRRRRPLPALRRRPAGGLPQRLVVAGQRVRLHEGEAGRPTGTASSRSSQASDPYEHLRSIHNGTRPLQPHPAVGDARQHPERLGRRGLRPGGPVPRRLPQADRLRRGEVRGGHPPALGEPLGRGDGPPLLAGDDRRHLRRPRRDVPAPRRTSSGGPRGASCTAQSPARIAFLRKILEDGPARGPRADRQVAGRRASPARRASITSSTSARRSRRNGPSRLPRASSTSP